MGDDEVANELGRSRPSAWIWVVLVFTIVSVSAVALLFVTADDESLSPTAPGALSQMSADDVMTLARQKVAAKRSVRTLLTAREDDGETSVDLRWVRGKGFEFRQHKGALESYVLCIDDTVYMKSNAVYWAQQLGASRARKAMKLLGNRFVKLPLSQTPYTPLRDMDPFAHLPTKGIQKIASRTIDGIATVGIGDPTERPTSGRIYLADDGTHLPVLLEIVDGSRTMKFTEWGQPVDLTVPRPSMAISSDELQRQLAVG